MRLTVLGAYGSFPGAEGACSGYLVEAEETRVLLDCGNGVLSRLQRYCRVEELDAIIVSHLHFDHMADLLVLQYGLGTKKLLGETIEQMSLHLPPTPEDVVKLLDYQDVFAKTFIRDGVLAQIGPLTVSFTRMEHSAESYAVGITEGGKKLAYSGDTVYNPGLIDAAQDADLFLSESTGLQGEHALSDEFPHMTARLAAEAARQARARRLLLTHYWYEVPREEYRAEARAVFPGAELAEELVTYEV